MPQAALKLAESPSASNFTEAVEWFASKLGAILTREEWDRLSLAARRRAFTVSGVARTEIVAGVWASLDRAIASGQSFADWKKLVAPALEKTWGGSVKNPSARIETIFRANVMSAYGAGRYKQLTNPLTLKLRPYWVYDSVLDGRTTSGCKTLNGAVAPADDPFWNDKIPPRHFRCRAGLRSLRKAQAEKLPRFGEKPPEVEPIDGWGSPPDGGEWEPDLSKYPDDIREKLELYLKGAPSAPMLPPKTLT